jgi:hypothetical protein
VFVLKDAATDAEDQRTIALHQRLEGGHVAAVDELLEQLGVGLVGRPGSADQATQHLAQLSARHGRCLLMSKCREGGE